MRQTKAIVRGRNDVMNTADTVNHEGNKAWSKSDVELLRQFAMTGTLGASFYATAKETTDEALELLKRADADSIADAVVLGRTEGFIRTFPILGLVELSKKSPEKFKAVFGEVIRTGNDLIDFIELCKSSRGLGRSVKTAISAWIAGHVNEYYAQKYRNQIADAVRLVRYRGDADPIYGYILAGYGDRLKTWTRDKEDAAYAKYPVLAAHKRFVDAVNAGDQSSACAILREFDLDVDSLTAYYDKFDVSVWREIARLSPVMRFMKYLNKFDRAGVFKKDIRLAEEKMTVHNFQKARVFPFRLYTAYMNIANGDLRDLLAQVLDQYAAAYDWGVFNEYSWAVCPDVSGSMQGTCGDNGRLRYIDIAGMFTGFFRKGLKNCKIVPWSHQVWNWNVPKNDSIVSHINALSRLNGGTDMSCALRFLIENGVKRDYFIFVTDTEEYGTRYFNGQSWIKSWIDYRNRVNSRAEAFILRGDSYVSNPFSDADAVKYGIHPIYGWNDNVVKYISYIVANRKKS